MPKYGSTLQPSCIALLLLLLTIPARPPLHAQSFTPSPALRDTLVGTVQALFDAMGSRDTAAVRRLMMPEGHAFAIVRRADTTATFTSDFPSFLKALTSAGDPWRERMWNATVLVHGNLAVVWAPYDFHDGTKFSHCGVDTFTLLRTQRSWRIADLAYTIEPTGCAPSPLGPLK